ncbi:MAG: hypothetical protein IKR19_03175 [Acholeplasmatales bacterium]|nr:hypothetical protein [Acholeplasmatales bacterium]
MKKSKILFASLLGLFSLSLMSCSLFNDDDIKVKNEFKKYEPATVETGVKAGDVYSKDVTEVPNTYCFKNISYATNESVLNTYKTGGVNENEFNVNNNEDYYGNKSKNNYDLYVPKNIDKSKNNTIILFIHGGAWVSGFKTDVNEYVYEFAKRGYVSATIKYSLLKRSMDDRSLSIFRNLDEIDACINSIKTVLKNDLGFDDTKLNLVIGGASSGAHLSMLYSYSRGDKCPLPIKFIIDAVGPTDIKENAWKKFNTVTDEILEAGITKSAIDAQEASSNIASLAVSGEDYRWNEYNTAKIANGMCGIPYSVDSIKASSSNEQFINNPNAASNAMTKVDGGEDQLSVTYWINKTSNRYPIICAYAGKDSIVGINQYATLQPALEAKSINHEFIYFKNSDHIEITKEKDEAKYNELINKIINWCENL